MQLVNTMKVPKHRIYILLLIALPLFSIAQENSPYSRYGIGNLVPKGNMQYRSMGGISAGASDPTVINFINPASYSNLIYTTLDIGADKILPYLRQPREENPALGWRSIRMAMDRPALLRLQARAMLIAGAGQDLKIMFPMIADVQEYLMAREAVMMEHAILTKRGHILPRSLKIGVMIEIPSLLWQLDNLLPLADFASIGSNDLVQFLFASDRGNPKLAGRYDPLSPAALGAMRQIVEKANQHGKTVTLCGELGGRPLEAMGLVGVGLTSMSMVPSGVGPVKAMIRSLDQAKLWNFMKPLLASPLHSLRGDLMEFAQRNGVEI